MLVKHFQLVRETDAVAGNSKEGLLRSALPGSPLSSAKKGIARLLPLGDDGSEAHHALPVDLFRGCHG